MALFPCPKCNKKISDTAVVCSHCGQKLVTVEFTCPNCEAWMCGLTGFSGVCWECGNRTNVPLPPAVAALAMLALAIVLSGPFRAERRRVWARSLERCVRPTTRRRATAFPLEVEALGSFCAASIIDADFQTLNQDLCRMYVGARASQGDDPSEILDNLMELVTLQAKNCRMTVPDRMIKTMLETATEHIRDIAAALETALQGHPRLPPLHL